jgi:diguanylate cyclase (GGDEF)-like protein
MSTADRRAGIKSRNYMAIGIALFLLINFSVIGSMVLVHLAARSALQKEIKARETAVQSMLVRMINSKIDTVIADLLHMSDMFELEFSGVVDQNYTFAGSETEAHWISLADRKIHYDKLRFIDAGGMEKLRVDYNTTGAISIPEYQLQDKSERYFFREALSVSKNQVYISNIDLNIDNEMVEDPIVPTLRLASPVYTSSGNFAGMIMINYELTEMLSSFSQFAQSSSSDSYWLNQDGYYLYNEPEPNRSWGFMYEDRQEDTFAIDEPEIWQQINEGSSSVITTSKGVYICMWFRHDSYFPSFEHIEHSLVSGRDRWLLVTEIEPNNPGWYLFEQNPLKILGWVIKDQREIMLIGFLLSLVFLLIWRLNSNNRRQLERYQYDQLTGALIRHSGLDRLQLQLKAARAEWVTITICFLDINGLKEVNDTYGHTCGDDLIRLVADAVRSEIRHSDYIIRMGGDEFMIVFYDADIALSEIVWQRINHRFTLLNNQRQSCSDPNMVAVAAELENNTPLANFAVSDRAVDDNEACYTRPYLISVSHGFHQLDPGSEYSLDQAIRDADSLMYQEKSKIKEHLNVIRQ